MGRPSNPDSPTGTARAAKGDRRLVEAGGWVTRVRLSPDAAAKARSLMEVRKLTLKGLIEALIAAA